MNKVYYGAEAQKIIVDGAKELYNAVRQTYGPTSGNVGIFSNLTGLDVSHDGATVARSIELKGPNQAGAEIIRKVAMKMDKELGDGTSTVVILAYSIIESVQGRILLGDSPIKIKDELQVEARIALHALEDFVQKEVTLETLKQVAAISASNDKIGAQVAEIVYQVGLDGTVEVEEGHSLEVEAEITEGYVIDNGAVSTYMLDNPETMKTDLANPEILLIDNKLKDLDVISEVIKGVKGKPLLVIAHDVSSAVVSTIVKFNRDGLTNIVFVKAPRFAEKRTEYLEDIAAFVGTTVIKDKEAVELGHADRVIVGAESTSIFSGHGDVSERKKVLEARIKKEDNDFEKTELQKRLSALTGKAATIRVGGHSEEEVSELKYRVDDAVFACQAALRSGVVAGGGTTPLDISQDLPDGSILKEVLAKPFKILLENVDLKDKDFEAGGGYGVNVRTGKLVDLFKEGIIEPADTIKTAIESAVSIAGTAITMKALVVEEEEDD